MHPIIKELEKRFVKEHAAFRVGDTIRVHLEIVEGEKKRVQLYEGVVTRQRGEGVNATITVRKISAGVAVEKIIPIYMPSIAKIEVVRKGKVRRAKLSYLVNRMGKASKVKEDIGSSESSHTAVKPAK